MRDYAVNEYSWCMTLTASKEKFCQHYATSRDASAAYRHAYNCRPDTKETTANVQGSKLLHDPNIRDRIDEIIAAATVTSKSVMDLAKIQDMWHDIATASPDELIGLRVGCCRYCWGFEHKYQWREREYLEALAQSERLAKLDPETPMPDPSGGLDFNHTIAPNDACPECRGEGVERVVARDTSKLSPGAKLLYGGLKKKRDGLEIIIASREKALENLTRMQGGYKDNVKVDGSIKAAAALVRLDTADPNEAAKAYADFIAGHLAT